MEPPIGRHLHWVARIVQRSFNDALESAGGSQPVWLILLSVKVKDYETQGDLARAIGVEGPTITHHLDAMEHDGLVIRKRDPDNRRAIRVELTSAGDRLFQSLREAAMGFDERLRDGISAADLETVRRSLTRMAENVSHSPPG